MREVTEAHYLHERHGLEAVLRPPVGQPAALRWVPKREELVVATRDGSLHNVDPVLGTSQLAADVGEAAAVDISSDRKRWLVVARDNTWKVGALRGDVELSGKHPFLGHIDGFFFHDYVVLLGDSMDGRFMMVLKDGVEKSMVKLPKQVVAVPDGSKLFLARPTAAGLDVIQFGKGKFRKLPPSGHILIRSRNRILGLTSTGIATWGTDGGPPESSMRMPEITAGDISKDGVMLGLGTRHGAVALARMDRVDARIKPDLVKAFDHPVTSAVFSDRGRWLATGGDRVQIWTWED